MWRKYIPLINRTGSKPLKFSRGITLIEGLIATLFITITFLAVAYAFTRANAHINELREETIVAYALQEQMDNVRAMAFDTITSAYNPTAGFTADGFAQLTGPSGTVTVDYPVSGETDIIRVTLDISWTSASGRARNKSIATLMTREGINRQ